jgi:hypothetical protein
MNSHFHFYYFREGSFYSRWYTKLSDEKLLGLYEKSIEVKNNEDFTKLLADEMKRRIVQKLKLSC